MDLISRVGAGKGEFLLFALTPPRVDSGRERVQEIADRRINFCQVVLHICLPYRCINFARDRVAERGRPSRDTILERFEAALDELRRFGGLPSPSEARSIWEDLWHLEAHNSTAIEGNTLVRREVAILLDKRRAVGAEDLKDYMEVHGYGNADQWVYSGTGVTFRVR